MDEPISLKISLVTRILLASSGFILCLLLILAGCFSSAPKVNTTATSEAFSELAKGVLQAEYPVTDTPHRGLCGDCPGRPALCSYDESMTLRDYPDEDAGGEPSGRPPTVSS